MTSELIPIHIVSLGCARNDADSEELAGRLHAGGFRLVSEPTHARAVLVNTCGFIEQAKKDSVDTLLEAADLRESVPDTAVIAVGCLAERYGSELAAALPEADAVLGFDDYPDIAERVRAVLAGQTPPAPQPQDRRRLLPLAPVARHGGAAPLPPGTAPAAGPRAPRFRLGASPSAPVKIASGCDRKCAFCAIPRFRGAYLSRPVEDVIAETRDLVRQGVREAFLVSENTSSYGKDLGDPHALEKLLTGLSGIDGLEWIRVSYLQPAEIKPTLVQAMTATAKVVPYFDISFQHASGALLRRMRRFGDGESFLSLLDRIRQLAPEAGVRTNVIVGFPGETEDDVALLRDFLTAARLDVVGVFGYSDEEDTEAHGLDRHLDEEEIEARRAHVADLVAELVSQRAEERIGERTTVLVEERDPEGFVGRAPHQGPEVDGATRLAPGNRAVAVGDLVPVTIVASDGVDLTGEAAG